jgi:hypothetical protein
MTATMRCTMVHKLDGNEALRTFTLLQAQNESLQNVFIVCRVLLSFAENTQRLLQGTHSLNELRRQERGIR